MFSSAPALSLTAIVVFAASVGLTNSLAQFVVGVSYFNECESFRMLPILLLASGLCAILMLTVCFVGGLALRFCGQSSCIKVASVSVFVLLMAVHFTLNGALWHAYSLVVATTPKSTGCHPQLVLTVKVAFPIALACGGALFVVPMIACFRCTSSPASDEDEGKVHSPECGEDRLSSGKVCHKGGGDSNDSSTAWSLVGEN